MANENIARIFKNYRNTLVTGEMLPKLTAKGRNLDNLSGWCDELQELVQRKLK